MKNKNWLNNIKKGKGKEIARLFFITFTTQEILSKFLYPNRKKKAKGKRKEKIHYVEPIINIRSKEWDSYGFLEKSKPIPFKDKLERQQYVYWKIMNLEPIYKFCKEYKQIEFTEEEKSYLKLLLLSEKIREAIIKEYSEDIIKATLMFYVKNCIMRYFTYLKDIEENPEKYLKEKKKAEELNNPTTEEGILSKKWSEKIKRQAYKKYAPLIPYKKSSFNIIKIITLNNWSKSPTPLNFLFQSYIHNIEDNKELVTSTDNKILKALNLQPSI